MIERTTLTINIVVIGKKNLNPGRSMTTSPGRWNKCNRPGMIRRMNLAFGIRLRVIVILVERVTLLM